MAGHVRIKRAYEAAQAEDGYRVLIDRLWPRGLRKEELEYDSWNKDLAPSPPLRKWFGHKTEHWEEFQDNYKTELRAPAQEARIRELISAAAGRNITLVYAAKDSQHNHATILADEINRLY